MKKRKFARAKAHTILGSLRGENDFLQLMTPEIRVELLFKACEDAHMSLKKLGTSTDELYELSKNPRKKKFRK